MIAPCRLGIDEELVALLGNYSPVGSAPLILLSCEMCIFLMHFYCQIPVTYAGGVTVMDDLESIKTAGMENVDVTVGSALDIFGGNLAYEDVVAWHNQQKVFVA